VRHLGSRQRIALAAILLYCPVAQAQDLARALAQPLSAGSVALLVFHPGEPAVVDRWTAALKDERPEVRAAAARVINASGADALVQPLEAALAIEDDYHAAQEEILALAVVGGRAADDALLKAAQRFKALGADIVASAIARARGRDALSLLPKLKAAGFKTNESFLTWATRGGTDGLTAAASAALRDRDAAAWEAALKLGRAKVALLDAGVLVAALAEQDETLRAEAYWHLALVQVTQGKLDDRVTAALTDPEFQRSVDLAGRLTFELLQRTLGSKPVELADWITALDQQKERAPYAAKLHLEPGLFRLLERRELEALSLATRGDPKALRDDAKQVRLPTAAPAVDADFVGTVDGFPKGFVQRVLEASGCAPARAHGLVLGQIIFSADGRPRRTALMDTKRSAELGGPPECTEAGRVLLGSTLSAGWIPERPKTMLVILDPDVLGCLAEPYVQPSRKMASTDESGFSQVLIQGTITEPKKTRNVAPIYPSNARDQRIQGVVILQALIAPTGCVSSVEVLRGVPALNWEAVRAVMKWRYTPTLLNGIPVPVFMTVTVNFKLQ
jgi:TonB family protein